MTTLIADAAPPPSRERSPSQMRLLIVEDNPVNLELLEDVLLDGGFEQVRGLTDPARTEEVCAEWEPDLILLDLHMPGLSGFEVLERLRDRTRAPENLPVVVMTADTGVAARHRALAAGARDFITKPFDVVEVELRVRAHLTTRSLQARLEADNSRLDRAVERRTAELERARLESLTVLASVVEYHDDDTHEHTRRVGTLAAMLGHAVGLSAAEVGRLQDAAPLHDIGKVGVSGVILLKPGALTVAERALMQRHAEMGAAMLADTVSPSLVLAREIARTHHERWDGGGYPAGLIADAIPLAGRICAVADVLDALTHARPYKAAWSLAQALATIDADSGSHFDPAIVEALAGIDTAALRRALCLEDGA